MRMCVCVSVCVCVIVCVCVRLCERLIDIGSVGPRLRISSPVNLNTGTGARARVISNYVGARSPVQIPGKNVQYLELMNTEKCAHFSMHKFHVKNNTYCMSKRS